MLLIPLEFGVRRLVTNTEFMFPRKWSVRVDGDGWMVCECAADDVLVNSLLVTC